METNILSNNLLHALSQCVRCVCCLPPYTHTNACGMLNVHTHADAHFSGGLVMSWDLCDSE